jgi:NADP-dependent 3-hydroxy acid dehydrogenase YdfG
MPYVNGGSYCITKFALLGFTKVLRAELISTPIRVTAILPGAVETPSWESAGLPSERFIPPADIANAVWACYQMAPSTVVEELVVRPLLGDI